MKMIWHEAITDNFCTGCKVFSYLFYKEDIIVIIKENELLIVTPVVDVINFILNEAHTTYFRVGTLKRPEI